MSLYSQNRIYAFTEEAFVEAEKIIADTKAKPEVSDEIEKKSEISDDIVKVDENYIDSFDESAIDEEFDQDDFELSLYIAEMQSKMSDTLDSIVESFIIVNEEEAEHVSGDVVDSDGNEVKDDKKPGTGVVPADHYKSDADNVEGEAKPNDDDKKQKINIKDLVANILNKLKEIATTLIGKIKEFAEKFNEGIISYSQVDKAIGTGSLQVVIRYREDDFNENFPGVKVNKAIVDEIYDEENPENITKFDFKKYTSAYENNKINGSMGKEQVDQAIDKTNNKLDEVDNELNSLIKGFNNKPELIKLNWKSTVQIVTQFTEKVLKNQGFTTGIEKQYSMMSKTATQTLQAAQLDAEKILKQVENQFSEGSEIVYAAKALYKQVTNVMLRTTKGLVRLSKYNLRKLSTMRKIALEAFSFCYAGKNKESDNGNDQYKEYKKEENTNESVDLFESAYSMNDNDFLEFAGFGEMMNSINYLAESQVKMTETLDAIFESGILLEEDEAEKKEEPEHMTGDEVNPDKKKIAREKVKAVLIKIKDKFIEIAKKLLGRIKDFYMKIKKLFDKLKIEAIYNMYYHAIDNCMNWKDFKGVECNKAIVDNFSVLAGEAFSSPFNFTEYSEIIDRGWHLFDDYSNKSVKPKDYLTDDSIKNKLEEVDKKVDDIVAKFESNETAVFDLSSNDKINEFLSIIRSFKKTGGYSYKVDEEMKNAEKVINVATKKAEEKLKTTEVEYSATSYKAIINSSLSILEHMAKSFAKMEKFNASVQKTLLKVFIAAGKYAKAHKPENVNSEETIKDLQKALVDQNRDKVLEEFYHISFYSFKNQATFNKAVSIIEADPNFEFDPDDGSAEKIKVDKTKSLFDGKDFISINTYDVSKILSKEIIEKIRSLWSEAIKLDEELKGKKTTTESVNNESEELSFQKSN